MVAIETERFLVAAVRVRSICETAVQAEIVGEPFAPGRHEFCTEVKAVTYHLLEVARRDTQWTGRVILDI